MVRPVWQDEGLGLQRTLAAIRAEGRVLTAGQDHEEMCRDGSRISGETLRSQGLTNCGLISGNIYIKTYPITLFIM